MSGVQEMSFRSVCTLLDHFSKKKMNQEQKKDLRNNLDLFFNVQLQVDIPETIDLKITIEKAVHDYAFNAIKLRMFPILKKNLQSVVDDCTIDSSAQWVDFMISRINVENINRLLHDFAHEEILFCNSRLIYEDPFEQIDTIFKDLDFDGNEPYLEEYRCLIKDSLDGLIDSSQESLEIPALLKNLTACLEGIVSENSVKWVDFMLEQLGYENQPLDSTILIPGSARSSEIRKKYHAFKNKITRMAPYLASKGAKFNESVSEAKKWFNLIGDYTWPFVFMFACLEKSGEEQEESLRVVSLHFSAYINNKIKHNHLKFDCNQHELFQICLEFMVSYLRNRTANLYESYLNGCQIAQQDKSTTPKAPAARKVTFPKGFAKVGRHKKRSEKHPSTLLATDPFGKYCRKHQELEQKLIPKHFYGFPIPKGMLKKSVIKGLTACDELWLREQYYFWRENPDRIKILRRSIDVLEVETVKKIEERRAELQDDFSKFEINFIPLIWKLKGSSKMDFETLKMILEGHRIFVGLNDEKASLYREIASKIYDTSRVIDTQQALIEKVKQWLLVRYLMENYDFPLNFPMRIRVYLKEYHRFMQGKLDGRVEEFGLQEQFIEERRERGQHFEIVPAPASCSTESSSLQLVGSKPLDKRASKRLSL